MKARHPELQRRQKRALKIIGAITSALMVALVLFVFALIIRTERAHDEQNCRFEPHAEQSFAGARVIEQTRRCLPEVIERRYLVERAGEARFELARKRLPSPQFAPERYTWSLRNDDAQKLVLRIAIDGKLVSEFFEEDVAR